MCGACLDSNGKSMYDYATSRETGVVIYNGARLDTNAEKYQIYKQRSNGLESYIARYE